MPTFLLFVIYQIHIIYMRKNASRFPAKSFFGTRLILCIFPAQKFLSDVSSVCVLVCSHTFSYTVMCKVCLRASITLLRTRQIQKSCANLRPLVSCSKYFAFKKIYNTRKSICFSPLLTGFKLMRWLHYVNIWKNNNNSLVRRDELSKILKNPGIHWFVIIIEIDKVYFIDSFLQSPKFFWEED